jgi:hypothetical protein
MNLNMKYKIYKLVYNSRVVYVGKTKRTLHQRKQNGYKGCSVESIYKDCDMVLIEETNDVSRERFWIEQYKDTILNIRKGNTGLSKEEYFKQWGVVNKEHKKQYNKEWRETNREHKSQYDKEWRESNREYYNEYMRERYQNKK